MEDVRATLRERSFRSGPGPKYNAISHAIREDADDVPVALYEIVLPPDAGWGWLCDVAVPRFVRYLRHKRLSPDSAEGVIVSVFDGDAFHMLQGPAFLGCYREYERLDHDAFADRVRAWIGSDRAPIGGLPACLPATVAAAPVPPTGPRDGD